LATGLEKHWASSTWLRRTIETETDQDREPEMRRAANAALLNIEGQ
jgi:hypothetical protein